MNLDRVHSIFHSGLNTRSEVKWRSGSCKLGSKFHSNESRNEIDVHYGRNKDSLQNGKFYSRIEVYEC